MDRKFYPENFERFLKGHADQFKMTPSKKVWHGIYNDLHPGRRWPSIAMSMIFIFTLVIIGHLNTNNGDKLFNDLASFNNSNIIKSAKKSTSAIPAKRFDSKNVIPANNSTTSNIENNDLSETTPLLSVIKDDEPFSTQGEPDIIKGQAEVIAETKKENTVSDKTENIIINPAYTDKGPEYLEKELSTIPAVKDPAIPVTSTKQIEIHPTPVETITNITPQANGTNISKPKRISNVSWSYYITPSISYRSLSDGKINNSVTHKIMLGYEGGFEMSYSTLKKLQFTTGFQLNYSGYRIQANNTHPITATLALNSEMPGQHDTYYAMSNFGNNTGTEMTKLKNYSLQASLPIGFKYIFGGNDNIKFGASASIQPSVIIASRAYLLSEDKKNYLSHPGLFRKWNLNSNLTTYISFSSNSFNWQIGPQVRYQLLSTYTKRYPVKEHLVNYGIHIGISKKSK